MTIHKSNIREMLSVADIVRRSDLPRWRKWLLKKLMPKELYDAPPQELMKMQAGAIIGSVSIDVMGEIDVGSK